MIILSTIQLNMLNEDEHYKYVELINPCLSVTLASDNWKHPIENFRPENGVYYKIQYLGAYPVNISIKTVEYKNRMKIARECIKRVCSELGIVISSKKSADRDVLSSIGTKSIECGHLQVWLRITTDTISMCQLNHQKTEESRRHSLQDISFACGGDQELLDYLSYVAKDPEIGRACFVFQSSKEPAKDIIMTIGQAFDLRFREYQRALLGTNLSDNKIDCQNAEIVTQSHQKESEWGFRPIQSQEDVPVTISKNISTVISSTQQSQQTAKVHCPYNETWYLGALSRIQAEKLLKFDGDFLVRDSTQQPNQYVLSGKQNGQCKHLLLVDPEGRVHTKDREFTSIKHLIEFHQQNKLPIASVDSELHLLYPISLKIDNQSR